MKKIIYLFVLVFALSNLSCSVYETFVNLSRIQFKLGQVNNFTINGIPISNKSKLSDFTTADVLKLSSAVAQGRLPVTFILNVEAKNPNDGTGGYKRTGANIKSFPWRLFINDKETISGNIVSQVFVPGTGEITPIQLQMNLDLVNFFKDRGYESLVNLALNIGGLGGSASNLALYAQPVVSTSIGDIKYPGELKIVEHSFTK